MNCRSNVSLKIIYSFVINFRPACANFHVILIEKAESLKTYAAREPIAVKDMRTMLNLTVIPLSDFVTSRYYIC
jgi:hypothetical protein